MREVLRGLVAENPMLKLALRSQYRSFLPGSASARTVWLLVGVVYVGLMALCATYAEVLVGDWLFFPTLVVMLLLPLNILHGSIAGEREKRSLDNLLVAPLTSAQIVFAKAARALAALALCLLLIVGPYLAVEIARPFSEPLVTHRSNPVAFSFVNGILLCAGAGLASAGLVMLVSSRTRTTSAALVGSLFVLLAWLLGVPLIAQLVFSRFGGGERADGVLASNPFVLLTEVASSTQRSNAEVSTRIALFTVAAAGVSVACFLAASSSLRSTKSGRRLPGA